MLSGPLKLLYGEIVRIDDELKTELNKNYRLSLKRRREQMEGAVMILEEIKRLKIKWTSTFRMDLKQKLG